MIGKAAGDGEAMNGEMVRQGDAEARRRADDEDEVKLVLLATAMAEALPSYLTRKTQAAASDRLVFTMNVLYTYNMNDKLEE
ncbi:MAG: hypothetical protein MI924_18790 [Chloroflexales bacterium]|nr:hypothetical protein [Chloroflexales bacterium]